MSKLDELIEATKENTAVLKELITLSDYFYNNAYSSVYNAMLAAHERFAAEKEVKKEQDKLHRLMAAQEQRRYESFLQAFNRGVEENDNH